MSMTDAPYSLRKRLLLRMGAALALMLAVLGMGLWFYARQAADYSYDRLLEGAALSILERVTVGADGLDVDLPYAALRMLSLTPDDRVFYQVRGPGDSYLTGYADLPRPPPHARHPAGVLQRRLCRARGTLHAGEPAITEQGIEGWCPCRWGQTRPGPPGHDRPPGPGRPGPAGSGRAGGSVVRGYRCAPGPGATA